MRQQRLDIYDRQNFAQHLVEQVLCFNTPFSVGLDAKWGDGKTYFVEHFLIPVCAAKELPIVIYDSFEHERETDPFISLTRQILMMAEEKLSKSAIPETKNSAINKVASSCSQFLKGLGKTTAKATSKILLKQTLDELGDNFSVDEAGEAADDFTAFIEAQLMQGKHIQTLKEQFQSNMSSLIAELSPIHNAIVVVIDELDRCRPNHAVDILEAVKHLLSVDGIYFVFTYHKTQLQSAFRHIYGSDLDANLYLQKFINLDISLPGGGVENNRDTCRNLFNQFLNVSKLDTPQKELVLRQAQYYPVLTEIYKLTPRELDRCVLMHIAYATKRLDEFNELTVALLIVLHVKHGDIDQHITAGGFPLPLDVLRKYKLNDTVANISARYESVRGKVERDIGLLMYERDEDGQVLKLNDSDVRYVVATIKKILGSRV